jgi:hypothetical protein
MSTSVISTTKKGGIIPPHTLDNGGATLPLQRNSHNAPPSTLLESADTDLPRVSISKPILVSLKWNALFDETGLSLIMHD